MSRHGLLAPVTADGASGPAAVTTPSRVLTRRRALPGSRAVVGGLLVTTAAVGLFAAHDAAGPAPAAAYVVATEDIRVGERLGRHNLATVRIDLPPAQRRVSFTDLGVLLGTVATARIGDGQLVQSTLVAESLPDGLVHVSVAIDPANAMNGDGLLGRRVDVVVTTDDGAFPVATTVARRVRVVEVVRGDDNLGNSGRLTVTLEVARGDAEAVALAGATGTVALVRLDG